MSEFDVDALLQPLSEDVPCGEDLVYDPSFSEMERAAERKVEQQFGDTVIPPEEPDWREVKNLALDLFSRTRDLRVAVFLTRAVLVTDGLVGLSDGLELLHGLLDRYWENIHPKLDPDDDNDPTERVNTLLSLCDPGTTLRSLQEIPLVVSRGFGRFCLRDIQIATGKVSPPAGGDPAGGDEEKEEKAVPTSSTIDAAFMDCDSEELQANTQAVERAVASLGALESLLSDRISVEMAPDLSPLAGLLDDLRRTLAEQQERRGIGGETGPEEEVEEIAEAGTEDGEGRGAYEAVSGNKTPPPPPRTGEKRSAPSGEINSREDAIRALDRVSAFFRKSEPSSPVPLLVERAKRLVNKNFMEILRDITPDGVSQAETISGVDADE